MIQPQASVSSSFRLESTTTTVTPTTKSTHHAPILDTNRNSSSDGHHAPEETKNVDVEDGSVDVTEILIELILRIGIAVISGYLLSLWTRRWIASLQQQSTDEDRKPSGYVYKRLQHILQKRQERHDRNTHLKKQTTTTTRSSAVVVNLPTLNSHELQMAEDVIDPDDIECSFADIGGLDHIKQEIYELAVLPLIRPELFQRPNNTGNPKRGTLVQPVKGILLYGQPGTGKTMLAKSLAKEAEAIFLPLQLSKILNKYWGESNKLIAATFSLANKLQPAIIFIDELDTFLKNSSTSGSNDSASSFMDSIKAEFLTLWDGVATSSQARVLVLGASNQPQRIDPAILRRMPRAFAVPLPDLDGRLSILNLLVQEEPLDESARQYLPILAQQTHGYSGSDLKELCKAAAMVPIQERTAEFARRRVRGEEPDDDDTQVQDILNQTLRPISAADLQIGLQKVQRTGAAARQYGEESMRRQESETPTSYADQLNSLRHLAAMLRTLSSLSVNEDQLDEIPNVR
jgi:SpoVK/Ycf46/Vps4 family AAA+-type ATPase